MLDGWDLSLGIEPKSGKLAQGAESETRKALASVTTVLEPGGPSLDKVVKTTLSLTDLADGPARKPVYREHLSDPPPARSAVQVAGLAGGAWVEIKCGHGPVMHRATI